MLDENKQVNKVILNQIQTESSKTFSFVIMSPVTPSVTSLVLTHLQKLIVFLTLSLRNFFLRFAEIIFCTETVSRHAVTFSVIILDRIEIPSYIKYLCVGN